MKIKTALKQSYVSVKFHSVAVVVFAVLAIAYPSVYTVIPLSVTALFLLSDAYNIRYIKRKAAKDATYLDKQIT